MVLAIVAFLRSPRYGLYIAFVSKPTLDLFWWAKSEGYISPLFIAGVSIPILAIMGASKISYRRKFLNIDKVVISYLIILATLTMLKIANEPKYMFNCIDSLARILSITLFYFIGRIYFQDTKSREKLILITILSVAVPFLLTLSQGALGVNIQNFSDVYTAGDDTGAISAYYLGGRHGLQRISGLYEGVYELAFMGGITLLVVYAMTEARNYKVKIWQYLLMAAGAYLFYFTYSRSAWVSVYVAVLLFFVMQNKTTKFMLLIGGAVVLYLSVQTVQYRFEDELGFFLGQKDFHQFGYSRGGKWIMLIEGFFRQDFVSQLIGNYGNGNPENQFLGMLFWWGYIGLMTFCIVILIFTLKIYSLLKKIAKINSVESKVMLMLGCFIMSSYWLAGNGNMFATMITTQWFLWTWTGIIVTGYTQPRMEEISTASKVINGSSSLHHVSKKV